VSLEALRGLALAALVVATFVVILRAFYAAFESQWPQHYFGGTRSVDPVISRTLFRYVAFRSGPVLLASIAAGAVAARLNLPRAPLVIAVVTVHALTGSGVGLVLALRESRPKIALAAYRLLAILVCAAAAVTALLIGDRADPYIPSGEEVASAFWVALAVFAVAHVGRSLTARKPDVPTLLARATREVPTELTQQLMESPITYPQAAVAIAYAEHLNRPTWARQLERLLKPRNGTYGLMQMSSRKSLSDQESVDLFIERLPDYPEISEEEQADDVRAFFLHHNDDTAFADLAEQFFWLLQSQDDT
jgi:hypothetical protein